MDKTHKPAVTATGRSRQELVTPREAALWSWGLLPRGRPRLQHEEGQPRGGAERTEQRRPREGAGGGESCRERAPGSLLLGVTAGVTQCVAFSERLLSLRNMHLRLLRVFLWLDGLFVAEEHSIVEGPGVPTSSLPKDSLLPPCSGSYDEAAVNVCVRGVVWV